MTNETIGWVIANMMPMRLPIEDPLEALVASFSLSSQDWAESSDFAWLYGIVCGWADEESDTYPLIQAKFGWTDEQVGRLKRLHANFRLQTFGAR